ncbi:MAG TPA: hypothetical protein VMV37_12770 [Gammaproteobacteria bacterium]|nr:hypothetical protein [Gammaproteobacteria bacterium]
MDRYTTNAAYRGSTRDASNLHFREQTREDAAEACGDTTTLEFDGKIRLSYDDELKCDPYNRTGRLTRGKR